MKARFAGWYLTIHKVTGSLSELVGVATSPEEKERKLAALRAQTELPYFENCTPAQKLPHLCGCWQRRTS